MEPPGLYTFNSVNNLNLSMKNEALSDCSFSFSYFLKSGHIVKIVNIFWAHTWSETLSWQRFKSGIRKKETFWVFWLSESLVFP